MYKLIGKREDEMNILVKEECADEYCNKCKHAEHYKDSTLCCIYGKSLNKTLKRVKFVLFNEYNRLPQCKHDQLLESKLLSVCNMDDKNNFYFIKNIVTHKKTYCSYKCDHFFAISEHRKTCRLFRKEIFNDLNKYIRLEECIQSEKDYLELEII